MLGTRCRLVTRAKGLTGSKCSLSLFKLIASRSQENPIFLFNFYIIISNEYKIQNRLLRRGKSSRRGSGRRSGAATDKTSINYLITINRALNVHLISGSLRGLCDLDIQMTVDGAVPYELVK